MRKRTTLYDEGDLFSIAPNLGRGCHFFIYDSEVEWQGPAIAKTVNGIISSGGEGSEWTLFQPVRGEQWERGSSACTLKHFCLPSHPPTMISLKGPDRPHFRPDNAFLPNLFSPQSLDSQSRGLFPGSRGSAYVSFFF